MQSNLAQLDAAVQNAATAFRNYSRQTGPRRAQLLRAIADGIEGLGERLLECVMRETALPQARVINERGRTCMQLRLFAALAEEGAWVDERTDMADAARQPPKPCVRSLLRPIGPVAIFGASNFPLAFSVAGGDTASALAVGCTVIVKAHPAHPETSKLIGQVIEDAVVRCALPRGVFTLVFDEGFEIGVALINHPLVKAGAFTGSQRGGLALLRVAQQRAEPIPFFAEMGSINPVFILPSALEARAEEIAVGLHASMVLGVGQFCTQPGLLFTTDDASGRTFLEKVARLVAGTACGTMLTAGMRNEYERLVTHRCSLPGVTTQARVDASTGTTAGAALCSVDARTFLSTPALQDEVFGPTTLAVLCDSASDYARCAERLHGQLTATVWTLGDEALAYDDLLWTLEQKVGRVLFNGFPTGVEVGTAMMHGGPFPATSDSRFTSVGTRAIQRFVRPIAYQGEMAALGKLAC
jgi:alpha-ketoglutaric semialdehyde dehydrogenase